MQIHTCTRSDKILFLSSLPKCLLNQNTTVVIWPCMYSYEKKKKIFRPFISFLFFLSCCLKKNRWIADVIIFLFLCSFIVYKRLTQFCFVTSLISKLRMLSFLQMHRFSRQLYENCRMNRWFVWSKQCRNYEICQGKWRSVFRPSPSICI